MNYTKRCVNGLLMCFFTVHVKGKGERVLQCVPEGGSHKFALQFSHIEDFIYACVCVYVIVCVLLFL